MRVGKPLEDAEIPVPDIGASDILIRVAAAGVCHSDAHYRAGVSKIDNLPVTPGHEVAGHVEEVGPEVSNVAVGDRVCLHYLVHCGTCEFCVRGLEQFCRSGQMIGKHRDGGYAEFINVPAKNVFALPDEISFEVGAIMMCSSATALHALNKTRLKPGESVAIFGFGGLGFSALQLARALGCGAIYIVEMRQAVQCLAPLGRAALVGLTAESMSIFPYLEIINKEAEIIGVSDHLATELPALIEFARSGKLRFPPETLRVVDLDAGQINAALDELQNSIDHVRTVIVPRNAP